MIQVLCCVSLIGLQQRTPASQLSYSYTTTVTHALPYHSTLPNVQPPLCTQLGGTAAEHASSSISGHTMFRGSIYGGGNAHIALMWSLVQDYVAVYMYLIGACVQLNARCQIQPIDPPSTLVPSLQVAMPSTS